MSRTVTLSQLRTDVVEQADLVDVDTTTFITTTVMNRWIVQSSRRFIGMLLGAYGDRYFESLHEFSTVVGTGQYALPSDFFQAYQVSAIRDGHVYALYPATDNEMAWGEDTSGEVEYARARPRYRLLGDYIEMVPVPSTVYRVQIRYAPTKIAYNSGGTAIADLSADTDYIDGINGWEQWIVYDVCCKALAKQREDFSEFTLLKNEIREDIYRDANNRDRQPMRVQETYQDDEPDHSYPWPGVW